MNSKKETKTEAFIFLKTGKVNEHIFIGAKVSPLCDVFQDWVHTQDIEDSSFYEYQNFFITAYEDRIIGIELDIFSKVDIGKSSLKKRDSLNKTLKVLLNEGITCVFEKKYTFDDQLCIKTEGNVDFLFSINSSNKIQLGKIIIFGFT